MPPVAKLLYAARRYLTGRHWIKNEDENEKGGVCSIGAVHRMRRELGLAHITGDDAIAILAEELPASWCGSVESFNDDRKTRKADVLALFERAINAALTKKKIT